MRNTSKVVVVTGGANGIGENVVIRYLNKGAEVIILDANRDKGEQLSADHGTLTFFDGDVADEVFVRTAFIEIESAFERVDVLVNNAAIQRYQSVLDCTGEEWDRIMAVNVKSYFLCAKYAIPLLKRAEAPVIVNMASTNSFVCMKNAAAYVTSKAAILGLNRSLAVDFAPWLRSVAICPGAVDTPALRRDFSEVAEDQREALIEETKAIHLTGKIASAKEVAAFVEFIASSEAPSATGQAYRIDGGIGVKAEGT